MMDERMAGWIVVAGGTYLAVGVVFAVAFVLAGVNRVDAAARDSTWGFRLMILPGSVALWPLLLTRWLGGRSAPAEKNAHRVAARKAS